MDLFALDKKNTNHRHRYPSKCIQPFQTCSKDIQLLWRLHIIIIRWKMEDLIGEVQHISSCILLRNQQPMTLHQNFILTNQIQIKKQADWLLSHYYVHNPFSSTLHDTTIHSLDPQPGRWIYTLNF